MPERKRLRSARAVFEPLLSLVAAFGVGFLFCMALALFLDVDPLELMTALIEGSWGSEDAVATTLSKTTPLLLTGLAVSLAYQVKLLNIGCEGQLTLGALASASFAVFAHTLPAPLLIPLTLLVGGLAGGLWAYPAIWLKQHRSVHEVITTLLMNYLAIYLVDYLARGPLGDGSAMGRTPEIPPAASWTGWLHPGSLEVTGAPFVALLLCFFAQVWLSKTMWGYEVKAAGNNSEAAKAAGISVNGWQIRIFMASGALAGLAGALEVVAVHHRFYSAFSPGYGFDGITAGFLVNTVPGWLWLSALLLASLRAADKWLQLAVSISPSAILVIQAVLLLGIACGPGLRGKWRSLYSEPAGPPPNKDRSAENNGGNPREESPSADRRPAAFSSSSSRAPASTRDGRP
jgi:simple sugar transport system permease protein